MPAFTSPTPDFDKAVADLQNNFSGDTHAYTDGQFYLAQAVRDRIAFNFESELTMDFRFIEVNSAGQHVLNASGKQVLKALKLLIYVPVDSINLDSIRKLLDTINISSPSIRAMFSSGQPGANENIRIERSFSAVWSRTQVTSAPYLPLLEPSIKMVRAAFAFEKVKCFDVCRAFAKQRLAMRGVKALAQNLKISMGIVANATPTGAPAGTGPTVPLQTIVYGAPTQLASAAVQMRSAIDAGAVIQCGVLSGARLDRSIANQPEHYVLAFAYGKVNNSDAFLFWDPDAAATSIATKAWSDGFGCLFSLPSHLSTAIDGTDLNAVDANMNSSTFGDHLNEPRRHRYQVYYLQTLPL
jgi:hypothetical protein